MKMFKLLTKLPSKKIFYNECLKLTQIRTLLSSSYYLNDEWNQRLNTPILQAIKIDDFYYKIDQHHQRTGEISAVDVDIFANALHDQHYVDELLDLLHKLRMTAETGSTLNSTHHAVVRYLFKQNKIEELLNALDDRLNYGIFLDYYTANILMDSFLKQKDYLSGVRVAAQQMLQEELDHPVTRYLSLLHCYKYLLEPREWPVIPLPEEPEEEVKIRVAYLRNPYDDEHFDLRDGNKIIGKILIGCTKNFNDSLSRSFHILGLTLFGKIDQAKKLLEESNKQNIKLCTEVLELIPKENEEIDVKSIQTQSIDIEKTLTELAQNAIKDVEKNDISNQCDKFTSYIDERQKALEAEQKRLETIKRLAEIEEIKKSLKERETKLWFFENEEKIELAIEEDEKERKEKEVTVKKTTSSVKKTDEDYVPPEIR